MEAAKLLNGLGRGRMSSFIADAVLAYHGGGGHTEVNVQCLEPVIRKMVMEQIKTLKSELQFKVPANEEEVDLSQNDEHPEETAQGIEDIMESLAAFRNFK